MTPKYFRNQLSVHQDVKERMYGGSSGSGKEAAPTGFIDQIEGW